MAASPEPSAILERILKGHQLTLASSMDEAEQSLREGTFELIVCTIVFDDSRMFDLLRLAKSRPESKAIPFVGARVRSHILRSKSALEAAAFTCKTLGAEAFLDIAEFEADPERELREAIESYLPGLPAAR